MRSRNIKPGFFKNEDLAECSLAARLCFVGLWMLADREGRLEDRPKRIKAELFAFDSIEVAPLLAELEQFGFIMRYAVEGRGFIQIKTFDKHQNPHHREPPSSIPSPQSPGLLGDESSDHGVETVLIPDSGFLIPDSGFLIPDSGEAHALPDPARAPPADAAVAPDGAARAGPSPASQAPPDAGQPEQPSPERPQATAAPPPSPTVAAVVCRAMRAVGLASVNPSSPELAALIDAGADEAAFVAAAATAVDRGKGFAYALAAVRGQMADAARAAAGVHGLGGAPPARASPSEPAWRAEQRQRTLQAVPGIAAKPLALRPEKLIETGADHVVAIAMG